MTLSAMRMQRYHCTACGARFTELTAPSVSGPPCPHCGAWQLRASEEAEAPAGTTTAPAGTTTAPAGATADTGGTRDPDAP